MEGGGSGRMFLCGPVPWSHETPTRRACRSSTDLDAVDNRHYTGPVRLDSLELQGITVGGQCLLGNLCARSKLPDNPLFTLLPSLGLGCPRLYFTLCHSLKLDMGGSLLSPPRPCRGRDLTCIATGGLGQSSSHSMEMRSTSLSMFFNLVWTPRWKRLSGCRGLK